MIFLFMHGGPSHVDTFDPKPRLIVDDGKPIPFKRELSFANVNLGGLKKSPWEFKQYGKSGIPVSSLFPHIATCVDDLCVVRSMVADGVDHQSAIVQLHTGLFAVNRPSMGSWTLYGLGTEGQNLPGFITIKPTRGQGGARCWSSNFLPGAYQGTPIGYSTTPVEDLINKPIDNLVGAVSTEEQRYELEFLQKINRQHANDRQQDPNLEARIQAFELAFRMQVEAPEVFEIDKESDATKKFIWARRRGHADLRLAVFAGSAAGRAGRPVCAMLTQWSGGKMGPAPPTRETAQRKRAGDGQANRRITQRSKGPRPTTRYVGSLGW